MNYSERLSNVTVVGAAGKMGRGIMLLMLKEVARLQLLSENSTMRFTVNALDLSMDGLNDLMVYLRHQMTRWAERNIVAIRQVYRQRVDLVENGDIVNAYVTETLVKVRLITQTADAAQSTVIFEAASEDKALKVRLLKALEEATKVEPWYFTNTSSIPVHELDDAVKLNGRILGFHFYNPPPVQRLVELIATPLVTREMTVFANLLVQNLGKIAVPSHDVAGFIGNGHFMREVLEGTKMVETLAERMGFVDAVVVVDRITRDFLMRPMGIFQLADYVGIDVVRFILKVMDERNSTESLYSQLIDDLFNQGVKGGQHADGTQRNGFFQYKKNLITGVYSLQARRYILLEEVNQRCEAWIGAYPVGLIAWKDLRQEKDADGLVEGIFESMRMRRTPAVDLALNFAMRSREIGLQLVEQGVAYTPHDVNVVLRNGFYHAWGVVNDFVGRGVML